jgi:hypothetical protein
MNPIEIFKNVREFLNLDANVIAAVIATAIVCVPATYWWVKRNTPKVIDLVKDIKVLENELLESYREVGKLRAEMRTLQANAGQAPSTPPLQQPILREEASPSEKKIMFWGKSISRDDLVAAMKKIDDEGGPTWTQKNTYAVEYDGRYYPVKSRYR